MNERTAVESKKKEEDRIKKESKRDRSKEEELGRRQDKKGEKAKEGRTKWQWMRRKTG